MNKHRTHNCNQTNHSYIGQNIKLSGWVHSKRDHGNLLFIDLRDYYGITQCVFDSSDKNLDLDQISSIKLESVINIEGEVVSRDQEAINPKLPTGEIEIKVNNFEIECLSQQIPFQINDKNDNPPEDLRLEYRFLDLRRQKLKENIILRSKVISFIREEMTKKDFLEIQTPILTSSSPEGARDYIVPSRIHPGKFYALPQAPQQFKQLLMVSGFDKYFQIAPCFRDEDLRADRAPEFYQLDMEMAFATQDDIFGAIEPLLRDIFKKFGNKAVEKGNFIKIPYEQSILKYGSDKPDLRNPIIISDVSNIFENSEFSIFTKQIQQGNVIRAIPAPKCSSKPRSFFDKMIQTATENGAKGLAYICFEENGTPKSPIAKFLSKEKLEELKTQCCLNNGDAVFFASGTKKEAAKIAGIVRNELGNQLNLIDKNIYKFCWIVDFPMYEISEETGKLDFSHNPFSMPQGGLETLLLSQEKFFKELIQYNHIDDSKKIGFQKENHIKLGSLSANQTLLTKLSLENQRKIKNILNNNLYTTIESNIPDKIIQNIREKIKNAIMTDPLNIKAYQYDVVCNGVELSSGAIRNHKLEIMEKAFEIVGYQKEELEESFGAMVKAFQYGAPPHGGIAPGIDRIIMLLCDEPNIRETIAFPMNGKAQDLLTLAPAEIDKKQLKELKINTITAN